MIGLRRLSHRHHKKMHSMISIWLPIEYYAPLPLPNKKFGGYTGMTFSICLSLQLCPVHIFLWRNIESSYFIQKLLMTWGYVTWIWTKVIYNAVSLLLYKLSSFYLLKAWKVSDRHNICQRNVGVGIKEIGHPRDQRTMWNRYSFGKVLYFNIYIFNCPCLW